MKWQLFKVLFLPFLFITTLLGQDTIWVRDITSRVPLSEYNQIEARNKALSNAQDEAIKRAFGSTINSSFYRKQTELLRDGNIEEANDDAVQLISETSSAVIVKKQIIKDTVENVARTSEAPVWYAVITIDALVTKGNKERDPNFILRVNGIKESYKEGESITMEIFSTQNCYLNIFNLAADGSVNHIFPNQIEQSNFLQAGTKVDIPGNDIYSLRPQLPDGKKTTSESLLIIATKDRAIFLFGEVKKNYGLADTRISQLEELINWKTRFPRNQYEEVIEGFVLNK